LHLCIFASLYLCVFSSLYLSTGVFLLFSFHLVFKCTL
jgi:hypothetical protein